MTRCYRFEDVQIDLQSFRLFKAGKAVPVEPKTLNLLVFLVKNPGRLVERRELIDAVWGDAFVTDHVLNRAIGQLRKLLADDAKEPRYIETVPTLGYRFIAGVEAEEVTSAVPIASEPEPFSQKAPAKQRGLAESSSSVISKSGDPQVASKPASEPVSAPSSRLLRRTAVAVGCALLVVVAFGAFWIEGRRGQVPGGVPIRSLAVLPLENLSGDSSQDYLADGMTDELITGLGQIGALRVISQTTAMQYKNARKPLPQIARELNVDAVVEGSVLRSGDRIRITAQLVNAPDDKQLWAHSYDGDLRDILGLQSQVASAVAAQIRIELTPQEQTQLADRHPVNPRAYEALLRGYFLEQNTWKTEQKSLQYFRQAAELDPNFARAYVAIARSYNFLGDAYYQPYWPAQTQPFPVGEATAAADAAVAKALQLEPELGEAYAERAWTLLFYHWDFPGTERDFRHALEVDPSASSSHEGYADYFVAVGRFEEGLQEIRRARDLDPLSPLVITDYCNSLRYARRYDDALAQCTGALELDPSYVWALEIAAEVQYMKADYAGAHKILARLGVSDAACVAMMDEIYGAHGVAGAFDSWLKTQKVEPSSFFLSLAYARLGRKDQAFASLEKAYEHRSEMHKMVFLGVDPRFDALRSDPRFDAFLRRVGLPPQLHAGVIQTNRLSN